MRWATGLAVLVGVVAVASCSPDPDAPSTATTAVPPTTTPQAEPTPAGAPGDNGTIKVFDGTTCGRTANASQVANPFSIGGTGFDPDESGQLTIATQPGGVEAYRATVTTSANGEFCETPISLPAGRYKAVFAFGSGTGKQKVFLVTDDSTTTEPTDTDPPTTDPPDTDPPDTGPPDTGPPDTGPVTTDSTDPATTVGPSSTTTSTSTTTTTTIVDSGGGAPSTTTSTTIVDSGPGAPSTDAPATTPPDSSGSGGPGGVTTTLGPGGGEQPVTGAEHVVLATIAAMVTAAGVLVIWLSRRPARSR